MSSDNPEDPKGTEGGGSGHSGENYGFEENSGEYGEYYDEGQGQLDSQGPSVTAPPGRSAMMLLIIGAFILLVLYYVFGGDDGEAEREAEEAAKEAAMPVRIAPEAPLPMQLPTPPPPEVQKTVVEELPPPPPPLLEEAFPPPPLAEFEATGVNDEMLLARRKSDMLIVNARQGTRPQNEQGMPQAGLESPNPNAQFASNVFRSSMAEKAEAKQMGNMQAMVAQGKIVHAIVETAINTDLPGSLRAVVSRDVYAEAGREPLIPKGSRLIGTYNTDVLFGQGRVFIIWTRVIRPDGVDVAINSPGVDQLGRGGVTGAVDNKYFEIYSAAVLTSVLNIGMAYGVESVADTEVTTTTDTEGNSTTNTSPSNEAAMESIQRLGQVTGRVVDRVINIRPTITVDQGTPINVFVNRDLIFPTQFGRSMQVIP